MYNLPEALLRAVTETYRSQIDALISIPAYIRSSSDLRLTPVTASSIQGTSVESSDITVSASLHSADMTHLGSFHLKDGIVQVSVIVNAYSDTAATRRTRISPAEEEAWARAVLGGKYSDYAYRVNIVRGALRPWFQPFVVFVDRDSTPQLAPSDFDWNKAWGFSSAQKLAPRLSNYDLVQDLLRYGQFRRDPELSSLPFGVQWRLEFVSGAMLKLAQPSGTDMTVSAFSYDGHALFTLQLKSQDGSKNLGPITVDLEQRQLNAEFRNPRVEGMDWIASVFASHQHQFD